MNSAQNNSASLIEKLEALVREQAQQVESGSFAAPSEWAGRAASPSDERFPRKSLMWAALPPLWTPELASAVEFPSPTSVESFLETMREEGLVEKNDMVARRRGKPELTNYEMTAAARSNVLAAYQQDTAGREELGAALSEIGRRIEAVSEKLEYVMPPVNRWAALAARAEDAGAMADYLDEITLKLFNERDGAGLKNWIDTGHQLAALFQQDLETPMRVVLQKASRRLELFYRLEMDAQHLKGFFEREDQTKAFRQFMSGPPAAWALHFVGAGGVGKTMLMRRITTRLAAEVRAITARIDFDYFNADYPRLAPGVLLWSFGQELRLYDERNEVSGKFDEADNLLRELHKRLQSERRADAPRATSDPMFKQALGWYTDAFRALSRQLDKKILLIVDTCEELARSRPDGSVPENVLETFRILRALHDGAQLLDDENLPPDPERGLQDLKVIFSGRRLLAGSGRGWRREGEATAPGRERIERPYLRLFEIRGFTRDEARRFLEMDETVPAHLIEPVIIRSSPDAGGIRRLVWDDPTFKPPELERCNPYELISYRDWAREKPSPEPDAILKASGAQYIELRIIGRLRDPALESLLPIVALLGRFNRETLEAVSNLDPKTFGADSGTRQVVGSPVRKQNAAFEAAFDKLQRQEWTHLRAEATSDGKDSRPVLIVEPNVRQRLLNYFQLRGALREAQERAASYLEATTLNEDLGQLDWSTFDAAMRVLELDPDPERATRWWDQVVERILHERDWLWLRDLISYLIAEDGAVAPPRSAPRTEPSRASSPDAVADAQPPARPPEPPASRLRPAVLAAHAATLMNLPDANRSKLYDLWRQVLDQLGADPVSDPFTRRVQLRAISGVISATRYVGISPEAERVKTFWRAVKTLRKSLPDVDVQVCVSLLAAIETIVEYAETLTDPVEVWTLFPVGGATDDDLRHFSLEHDLLPGLFEIHRNTSEDETRFRELAAFSHTLSGRIYAVRKMYRVEKRSFDAALEELEHLPIIDQKPKAHWFDWLPPDDIAARVRLEYIRALYPRKRSPAEILEQSQNWQTNLETIDGERLAATRLRLQLAQRPVALEALSERGWIIETAGAIDFGRVKFNSGAEVCNAHRQTPPLFAVVAEALAAMGEADEVLKQLGEVITQVRQHGPASTRHAERAHARIAQRMRFISEESRDYNLLATSPFISDRALVWSLDGMNGRRNQKPLPSPPDAKDPRPWLHAIWQTLYLSEENRSKEAQSVFEKLRAAHDPVAFLKNIEKLTPLPASGQLSLRQRLNVEREELLLLQSLDFTQVSLHCDVIEASSLVDERRAGEKTVYELASPSEGFVKLFDSFEQPEECLTIWLRYCALGEADAVPSHVADKLIEKIGMRRAAEIALSEGELLALRLPDTRSVETLLQQALDWFSKAEDDFGVIAAGLSLVLARGPDASELKSKRTLDEIEKAYQRLRDKPRLREALWLWEDLESEAVLSAGSGFEHLNRVRAWRPLVIRLLLALANGQGNEQKKRERTVQLLTTLARPYAVEQAGALVWTADLDRWAVPVQETRKASNHWQLVIALLINGAALVGGFFLFRWLAAKLIDIQNFSLPGQILIYTATLPFIGLMLWRLYKEARTTLLEVSTEETPPLNLFSGWKNSAVVCAVLVIGLALWFGGDFFSFNAFGGAEPSPSSSWQIVFKLMLAALIALPGVVLLFRLLRTVSRLLRNLSDVLRPLVLQSFWMTMSVNHDAESVGDKATESVGEASPVEIGQTFQLPQFLTSLPYPFSFKPHKWLSGNAIVSPLAAYREMDKAMPAEHLKNYKQLRKMLRGSAFEIEIDVADRLHGTCWEAMFAYALPGEENSAPPSPFRFRRSSPTRKNRAVHRLKKATVASWVGSVMARGVAKSAWKGLQEDSRFAVQINQSEYDLFNRDIVKTSNGREVFMTGETLQVLHLVGTAEDTNGGVRLRLDQEGRPSSSKKSLEEESSDRIVGAEEIAARFTNLSLCVIQGDPQKASLTERNATDRQRAALTRVFAAKLFTAGVPAVLVIPPLKPTLAAAVLERVATILTRQPRRGTRALLEATAEIAELVSKQSEMSPADASEKALDVCLYAVKDWNGRLIS